MFSLLIYQIIPFKWEYQTGENMEKRFRACADIRINGNFTNQLTCGK